VANPSGQFAVLKAAEPAYKLLGVEGCVADKMPEVNHLIDSRLGTGPARQARDEPAGLEDVHGLRDKWLK